MGSHEDPWQKGPLEMLGALLTYPLGVRFCGGINRAQNRDPEALGLPPKPPQKP